MGAILLTNVSVEGESGETTSILVVDGILETVSGHPESPDVAQIIDCEEVFCFPGFIDIHNHGAVGVDVNSADVDALLGVARFLAQNGVTAWMPTLVPDSDDNYRRVIDIIDEVMSVQDGMPLAQVVGVHYEGVFANEAMCGALRPEFFKSGQREERTTPSTRSHHPVTEAVPPPLLRQEGSSGHPSFVRRGAFVGLPRLKSGVHMTTLAPEIDGGIALIESLVADGWVVSIGHTRAVAPTLDRAFAAGARHMTHFFNAMTGVHHRDMGVAGWGLVNDDVTFDIIADGVHVHTEMLAFACRAKSPEKVSLISDSVAPTGLGDGEFELWGETVSVRNGRTQNERGSIAGSVCTMLDCFRTMRSLGFSDHELSLMTSANPARLLGLDQNRGSIEAGKRADLVALDAAGKVVFTMIAGVISGRKHDR